MASSDRLWPGKILNFTLLFRCRSDTPRSWSTWGCVLTGRNSVFTPLSAGRARPRIPLHPWTDGFARRTIVGAVPLHVVQVYWRGGCRWGDKDECLTMDLVRGYRSPSHSDAPTLKRTWPVTISGVDPGIPPKCNAPKWVILRAQPTS